MTVRTPTIDTGRGAGPLSRDRLLIAAGLAVLIATIVAVVVWQTRGGDEAVVETPSATITEPAPLPAAPATPATTESATQSVVIVGSEEAAQRLRVALGEADAVRGAMGLSPLDTQIVVAATDAEAERIAAATQDANGIRVQLGLPEIPVTDLR